MTNNKALEFALKAGSRGWPVFPLRQKGKEPLVEWKEACSSSPDVINAWAEEFPDCNFGVHLGQAGLTVLDVDTHGAHDGHASLTELLDFHFEELPKTFTVDTPSGGKHIYFEGDMDGRNGAVKFRPGLEARTGNMYVVLPGSTHPDFEGLYEASGSAELLPLPTWLKEDIHKKLSEKPSTDIKDVKIELDSPDSIVDSAAYLLNEAPVAIQGDSGDLTTYNVSCALRDRGLTPEVAYDLLLRLWNQRCEPPWHGKDLHRKLLNAYNYAQNPAGTLTNEYKLHEAYLAFKAEGAYKDAPLSKKGPVDFTEFAGSPPPKIPFAIQNWLYAGENSLTLFTGQGGTGKSHVALDLAISLATERPWYGMPVLMKMPSLYVACEDPDNIIHARVRGHVTGVDSVTVPPGFIQLWSRIGTDNTLARVKRGGGFAETAFFGELVRRCLELTPDLKLLILDTLTDIFSGDENSRSEAGQFVKTVLAKLSKEANAMVLVLAHPPKSGSEYSGSSAWQGGFRSMWVLRPHEDDSKSKDVKVLTLGKSNYAAPGEEIHLKYESGRYVKADMAKVNDELERDIYNKVSDAYVEGNPFGKSVRSNRFIGLLELADPVSGLKVSAESILKHVECMISDGRIEYRKDRRGTMVLRP